MVVYLTGLVSLLLAALSLGPSFAHVLEARWDHLEQCGKYKGIERRRERV